MSFTRYTHLAAALLLGSALSTQAQTPSQADAVAKIRDEGLNRSQVMRTLSYLTDVIGPRLTGTPALRRANEWTRDELTRIGCQNARLEAWGPFGRGWTLRGFEASMTTPQVRPLEAFPKAWSPNTEVKDAEVVWVNAQSVAELEKFRGKLRGKVVLSGPIREVKPHFEPEATRLTEKDLLRMADSPGPEDKPVVPGAQTPEAQERQRQRRRSLMLAATRATFYQQEGVAFILDPSRAGDGGNIFVQQASVATTLDTTNMEAMWRSGVKPWDKSAPTIVPQAAVGIETYNRLARMLDQGERVTVSLRLQAEFHDQDLNAYNTLAELPGTDKKDEVVMLGGHLDSWHGGTGATDNAAGVAVCMEAMRILKAAGLQPRRTIRVALWSGEEQGLYGSEAYVKQHLGERLPVPAGAPAGTVGRVVTKPDHAKLSAYYNLDNGAGKIRGIYLQGNEAARAVFRPWLHMFKDLGASTITADNTGGTDHLSFDEVGLPGFQFIQDDLEYFTRTHHSTQDVYDRAPTEDMKQAATIMAAMVYLTAMRDEPIPRKPLPGTKPAAKPVRRS